MEFAKRFGWLLAVMAVIAAAHVGWAQERKIDARLVSYDELAQIVRQNRGKVVVVDIWFPG